jgi:hypothetical protein
MANQFVSLQISEEQVRTGDVSVLERFFNTPEITPRRAREARASMMLTFPMYDRDPREVWEVPEAQVFFQALSRAVPHMPYFIVPHEKVGQIMLWLFAVVGATRLDSGATQFDMNALRQALVAMLKSVHAFCIEMRDDPDEVVPTLLLGLPRQLREHLGIDA